MYNAMYSPQVAKERIDSQIAQLQQMKEQLQPMPSLTQNFQLTPSQSGIRYADTMEEVKKEIVFNETAFFSKDLSILWLKGTSGDIRIFSLEEIKEKDEKDLMIESLQYQIEELKKGIRYEKSNVSNDDATIKNEKPTSSKSNARNDK